MKNIVLTGFMSCGKTTLGKIISEKLSMDFYDTDELIKRRENLDISEIFASFGEDYFRELEAKCCIMLSKNTNSVIAVGGGTVLNASNIDTLRRNGVIINLLVSDEIIKRRLSEARSTRPLLQEKSIDDVLKLYSERKEYYKNCDISIDVSDFDNPNEASDYIIEVYTEYIKGKEDIL